MNDRELAWVSGLLEGEGCFGTCTKGGNRIYATVQVNMNDKDVLERLALIVGRGNVGGPYGEGRSDMPNAKGYYKWALSGQPALDLMIALAPLMCSRRYAKIKFCIEAVQEQLSA